MDIQQLVDRMEQMLNESSRLPMSAYLMVNEDEIFNLVDQIRVAVPEEIKRAGRIEAEKERILAQANEEADRIRELAKQEASDLVRRDAIMNTAQQRSENILERARREADGMRQEADRYAVDVLAKLESDLTRLITVVRNGLANLQPPEEMVEEYPEEQ